MAARKVWCVYNWDGANPRILSAWSTEDKALKALEEEETRTPSSVLFVNEVSVL